MLSVQGIKEIKQTGKILHKNAREEEYSWGVRFFVLLSESLMFWGISDESGEMGKAIADLQKRGVYFPEKQIYINGLGKDMEKQHKKLDNLLSSEKDKEKNKVNGVKEGYEDRKNKDNPVMELKKLKDNFLDSLFSDNVNPDELVENEIFFLSYYDSNKQVFNNIVFEGEDNFTDKEIDEIIKDQKFASDLNNYKEINNPNYNNKEDIKKSQKDIFNLLKENYEREFLEYEKYVKNKSREFSYVDKKSVDNLSEGRFNDHVNGSSDKVSFNPGKLGHNNNEKSIYDYGKSFEIEEGNEIVLNTIAPKQRKPVKTKASQRTNNNKSIFLVEEENKDLLLEEEKLKEEIKELKKREIQLKLNNSRLKGSSRLNKLSKPDYLIKEINRKDKEYNLLRAKYNNLMTEINSKVYSSYKTLDTSKKNIINLTTESTYKFNNKSLLLRQSRYSKSTRYFKQQPEDVYTNRHNRSSRFHKQQPERVFTSRYTRRQL